MSKPAKPKTKTSKSPTTSVIQEFDHAGRHRLVFVRADGTTVHGAWVPAGVIGQDADSRLLSIPMSVGTHPQGVYRLSPVKHSRLAG